MASYRIEGFALKGFESVKRLFEDNFRNGKERGAQLCVYVDNRIVVDLWGATKKESPNYDGDSLCAIMSSGKNFDVIAIATLVEKNLLRYSDRVVDHWPEFAKGDERKASLTIAQVMKHEGGIPFLQRSLSIPETRIAAVKRNSIGQVIESEPLNFPPSEANTTREYHTFTRTLILNEIYRRVDPKGRTIGEFLRDEIREPLGAEGYCGLDEEQCLKKINCSALSVRRVLLESMKPECCGRKIVPNFWKLLKRSFGTKRRNGSPVIEGMGSGLMSLIRLSSSNPDICCSPYASARGLARMAAMMANKGSFNGVPIISEETWNQIHDDYDSKMVYGFGIEMSFSQGGVGLLRRGYVGWMGIGGSIFQWHPEYNIGFGYVPTLLSWEDGSNRKGGLLQREVVECVKRQKESTPIYCIYWN